MTDYEAAFSAFQASGGRAGLVAQLRAVEELASHEIAAGREVSSGVAALVEGLQRLIGALDELAATAAPDPDAPGRGSDG